ncbi:hypothetical protein MHU86_7911 [Fragilaria crotonensis]|nr:hypothetical protein MHU86_7911 [Fragilaria crotonensis]
MSAKYIMLSMLTLSTRSWSAAAATTNNDTEYVTNDSQDGTGAPYRVIIPPFTLTLTPASALTTTQGDLIEELAEDVLHDYLPTKLDQGVTVDYVDLIVSNHGRVRWRHLQQDDSSAVLEVSGGVASFRGGKPPLEEVNEWVSQALEGNLLEILQAETDLNTVEKIEFNSLSAPPTPSPAAAAPPGSGSSQGGTDDISRVQTTETNPTHSFAFVAAIVGGVAIISLVILAAIAVGGRRRSATVEPIGEGGAKRRVTPAGGIDDDITGDGEEDDDDSEEGDTLETGQNLPKFEEAESVSHSMWTMSTNATDAYTVRSGKLFPRVSHTLMQTESFERDRQVSLKKDMLETTWSSAIPHESVKKTKDTLLTPSHFSVVEQSQSTDSYEADKNWNPDDNEVSTSVDHDSPFLFAAQGEEVVLMPPSRVRSSRRGI